MASAFARYHAGDRLAVDSAGSAPEKEINPTMIEAMGERGIDMAFRSPKSIDAAARFEEPDLIVTMGCGDTCPMFPGVKTIAWDLPDPAGRSLNFMRKVRDEIEKKVKGIIP
ncbi:MAG: phosphotyrosine protein phosphatase [Deltaproteobacteria bacterium]|nr:phosphotyrosine protein phosphatase [Deltaproteobacteria bacterium]